MQETMNLWRLQIPRPTKKHQAQSIRTNPTRRAIEIAKLPRWTAPEHRNGFKIFFFKEIEKQKMVQVIKSKKSCRF